MAQLLEGTKVKVAFKDFDSGNALRTQNIMETLLVKVAGFHGAEGVIQAVDADQLHFQLSFNGKTKSYQWPWEKVNKPEGLMLRVSGPIELKDFLPSRHILNFAKRCEALHTGEDGVSKTWSDVTVLVEAAILSECL